MIILNDRLFERPPVVATALTRAALLAHYASGNAVGSSRAAVDGVSATALEAAVSESMTDATAPVAAAAGTVHSIYDDGAALAPSERGVAAAATARVAVAQPDEFHFAIDVEFDSDDVFVQRLPQHAVRASCSLLLGVVNLPLIAVERVEVSVRSDGSEVTQMVRDLNFRYIPFRAKPSHHLTCPPPH